MAQGTSAAKELLMRGRFVWLAGLACLGPGLVADAGAADSPHQPAASLPPYQRLLRGADARKAKGLEEQLAKDLAAGRLEEARGAAEAVLALRRRVQGADHWQTVSARWQVEAIRRARQAYAADRGSKPNVQAMRREAAEAEGRGRHRAVERLREQVLRRQREVTGDDHPSTAVAYAQLANNLDDQYRYVAAEPLYRRALAIDRQALGEAHPDTAIAYNNLATNLDEQGRYTAAEPLYRKALAIRQHVLGDEHPDTVASYNNLGYIFWAQDRLTAARPLFEKTLMIRRKILGEDHPDTATLYNNLASTLDRQGQHAAAQPLYQRALDIYRGRPGEGHARTAFAYHNLAGNLDDQGKFAQAQPLHERALAISRKALGDQSPQTADCYRGLATNLWHQQKCAAAEPLRKRAVAICRDVLGELHPETATAYNDLAATLHGQGRYAAAQPLFERVLAIRRQILGEDHPVSGLSWNNLAANLHAQGRYAQAETYWTRGAGVLARARLLTAATGLARATDTALFSPLPRLAAVLARNGKPERAWQRFEENLARGTWDDLSARLRRSPADRDRQTALVQDLRRLDQLIERTLAAKAAPESQARRQELLTQRHNKGDELAALTERLEKEHGPVAGQVYDRAAVQHALPPDAALVGWIDIPGQPEAADPDGEHWAVLVRARGKPVWRRLPGSGAARAWAIADTRLPADLRRALHDPAADWRPLADRLREQRLAPLATYLAAGDGLPAVRRLVVLPSPALAGVPVEVCAGAYTVSYAPSGTILAYLRGLPPTDSRGMLAVADPVFDAVRSDPGRAPLPPGGLLVTMVVPGGNAAGARLRADDVLLRYAGSDLKDAADLGRLIQKHAADKEVGLTFWRAGRTAERTVAGGPLGVALARQPAPAALAERYKNDGLVARSRAGAQGDWRQLPGTRAEAERLRSLCERAGVPCRLLADSDASEQELDRLAGSKELAGCRYIHLAPHGDLNDRMPLQSAVILAHDCLPDPLKQLEAGKPVYDGRLTAEEVLEKWDLHADLVTLSACETALGKYEGGEGFVGFTQALLLSGARSVCLSLWKVDDTATALLMQRFYANLLGQRPGLKKPLGKAEALAEAKRWLRDLSAEEVARQAAALTQGVARGKGRKPLPLFPTAKNSAATKAARPYAHPYYWAAFVLVGGGD
jgi:tetratricopeptide (TPR) repeat protein